MKWIELSAEKQLDELIDESKSRAVAIFKHSTRCSTSKMVKRGLESDWEGQEEMIRPYFLDLIAYRSVSNLIAAKFGIRHESPQLILLKNGKPVYNASHASIDFADMKSFAASTA